MGQYQQNLPARAALLRAEEIAQNKSPKMESGDLGKDWLRWITAQALIREAQALIGGASETRAETK